MDISQCDINMEIYLRLMERVEEAEKKHPVFSVGVYQALGYLGEEYGEVVKCVTKGESDKRRQDELLDLLVVAWRFYRGDWRVEE